MNSDNRAAPVRIQRKRLPGGETLRLHAIDAPEIGRARCEAELVAGLQAKARLRALLAGRAVTVERCEPSTGRCVDRYGRTLAAVTIDAGDVALILIAERHAEPWRPGPEAAAARAARWCRR
jgi:endonuclease YncB( thermonuclease family)